MSFNRIFRINVIMIVSQCFFLLALSQPTKLKIPKTKQFLEQQQLCTNSSTTLVFKADFAESSVSKAFGGAGINFGKNNVILLPVDGKEGEEAGIEVVYPAGSYVPSGPIRGGFGLSTKHRNINPRKTAVLKYSVYFPDDFDFVKGGKLPGLYGGRKGCGGGDPAYDCFSARMMWRTDGQGEVYLYADRQSQDPAICKMPSNRCNPTYGWSLSRGAFTFQRGAWTDIEQRIKLNTPGERDGTIVVKVNGVEVIRYNNIVFRTAKYPKMKVNGMNVVTFFGGGDPSWASPIRQVAKFKGFILESQ